MARIFSIILATCIGFVCSTIENYDYCDPKQKLCDVPVDHVMCKYPVSGLSEKCTPGIFEPLSSSEKKQILFWHNKFRSHIAVKNERRLNKKLPTASNMRQLYWDKELEQLAERWAQQCVSSTSTKVHDKCRNIRRFHVSQNVGTRRVNGTTIDKQALQIVVSWFLESKDFLPDYIDSFPQFGEEKITMKQCANVLWAETYAVGCARAIFQENVFLREKGSKKTIKWAVERLICNYGPGGSIVGRPLYKRGLPCENCPNGTECSQVHPGLCATPNAELLESRPNVERQENKESSEETTARVSAIDITTKSQITEENEDNFLVDDAIKDEEQEATSEIHTKRPSDLNRIQEVLENPSWGTEVEGSGDESADGNFVDFAGRGSTDERVVFLANKKTEKNDMKKRKREAAAKKPIHKGERCICYFPVQGEHNSAPRKGFTLLFCAFSVIFLNF